MFQVNNLSSSEPQESGCLILNATSTTASSLPSPPQHVHKKQKLCLHYGGEEEGQEQCPAQRALSWLIQKGVERGKPQDLFDKARESKRMQICAKTGRQQKPIMKMGSSLLNRRGKKSE